jgi:sulfur oxygenase/reductase
MTIDLKAAYDAEPKSPLYVAINKVLVENDPNLMRMMKEASSKMCLATALTPGFRGFNLMRQMGSESVAHLDRSVHLLGLGRGARGIP